MKTLMKLATLLVAIGGMTRGAALGHTQAPGATGPVIAGYVTDAATGQPIAYATVGFEGDGPSTLTSRSGAFVLTLPGAVDQGERVVRVTAPGYGTVVKTVRVATPATRLDFELDGEEGTAPPGGLEAMEAHSRPARSAANQAIAADAAWTSAPQHHRTSLEPRRAPVFNTESYAYLSENPFLAAVGNPLSTFSIDVDRASYANVRRFITAGERPPTDAVRIEEMLNYFHYDHPEVHGEHPFDIHTEVARAPWNTRHLLVKIGLQGRRPQLDRLPPSNLVFLLDVSGSMASPDKLPLLKQAFRLLVSELRTEDRVAIVVYAGAAGLVLDSTPGDQKGEIFAAIEALESGGSTAGGAGIRLAYKVARDHYVPGGNNRVILATDGDFNVGESSDAEMIRLIQEKREEGTFLTVLGFGTGNLKDSKMERIADHGNGNFAYIDSMLEARKVLVTEIGGTLFTIAKDVKVQVEFNPNVVEGYRLIGYENRMLAHVDFNDDTKDAGELGAGHTVTALYEVVPKGTGDVRFETVDPLRYQDQREMTSDPSELAGTDELMYVKLRYQQPDGARSRLLTHPVSSEIGRGSDDFRFAAAVAGFGMLLQDSEHCGDWAVDDVLELARRSRGVDAEGYRAEFIRLVETARVLEILVD